MLQWDPRALRVMDQLRQAGYCTVLVGGCVRDFLLGLQPHDYDAATAATPEEMLKVFCGWKVVETGRRHGTLTIFSDGLPVEVTTFRTEGAYTDHRHPDGVRFTRSLEKDLARRDFTVNAMAWRPEGFVDLFGGQEDLQKKRLCCVGTPGRRFEEDALRMLRGLRFAAQLGFQLDKDTETALRAHFPQLDAVSRERVAEEFLKLICAPGAVQVLLDYPEVIGQIIPELRPAMGFEQHTPYHCYDVYTHCVQAMGGTPPNRILRLAALLHDVGKPKTYVVDADGVGHFPEHAQVSAEIAEGVLRRLRLDRATREQVVTLIARHGMRLPVEERVVRRWLSRLGAELFFHLMTLDQADNQAKRPEMVAEPQHWRDLYQLAQQVLARSDCLSRTDLAVNGRDALQAGLRGQEIGRTLERILEDVVEGRLENDRETLLHVLRRSKST